MGLWRALNPAVEADLARRHVTLLLVWAGTVFSFVAVVVLVSRARGRDLARELRRPWLQLIAAKALAMGVGRVAMLALLPGAAPTFAGELSMDVSLAVLATTLGRRFAWIALPPLLALAGICVEPALASPLYSVAIACELIIASWATSAHSRERDAADARRPTVPG